jgi:predicted TIM-barrel fold metal-dependent hydrolase
VIRGMTVLDTHHHVGDATALGIVIGDAPTDGSDLRAADVAARLGTMDDTGVDQAILIPGHGYLRPGGLADNRRVNDDIAAYRDAHPDRFPAALGIVEPLHGPAGLAELDRIHGELGLVGVSFHTRWQGVSTQSPLVIDLVHRMAELGLVPYLHGVAEVADEALWKVQEVARCEPDTTMVVLDAFSSFEQGQQAVRVAADTPNLVFDTSLAHDSIAMARFVAEIGPERLVFGTDVYSHVRARRNPTLDLVLELGLSDAELAGVLAGNTRRVLGLA